MRFSLQDVKKQVQRRSGEPYVSLHFLRQGELHSEIERLIAYHEQLLGQPQRQFPLDEARACIGDYRLAHCLISTLSAWYSWRVPGWADALSPIEHKAQQLLCDAGITSPIYLRLALFNYVNERFSGFLESSQRTEALQAFASLYQLNLSELEYLLVLDSDEEEMLTREAAQPPRSQDVATLYNQWAFEAALFNASQVRFIIDCKAFEQASLTASAPRTTGAGIGAVIKRLCYLARLLGVYYDLAYEPALPQTAPLLHLTLYGPQEMTGAPQHYGIRLARLCRLLLGYGFVQRQFHKGAVGSAKQSNAPKSSQALDKAIVEAEATIHFLQRSYCFAIDAHVLSLLPPEPAQAVPASGALQATPTTQPVEASSSVFDSGIEQSFAEAFTSLQQSSAVDGWHLLREPEPLLLDQSIFIPDFALTRAGQRIYVEILGFWTPSYRERKIQKLQQLQGREDIVLAIPVEAHEAFQSITEHFPIVWYEGQLSATALLHILRSRYDTFAERLASINVAEVRKRVRSTGLLPERACYDLLHCYRRSELALAAEHVTDAELLFISGIGLYDSHWMEQVRHSFVEEIGSAGTVALSDVLRECKTRWSALAQCENATIEAILDLWPEVAVRRNSIFEATVALAREASVGTGGSGDVDAGAASRGKDTREASVGTGGSGDVDAGASCLSSSPGKDANVPNKQPPRKKRAAPKKRVVKEVAQGDLWS